jgi:hypothetical protein
MTKPDAGGDKIGETGGDEVEPEAPAEPADLKATVQLSGEALAALLEEVRSAQKQRDDAADAQQSEPDQDG